MPGAHMAKASLRDRSPRSPRVQAPPRELEQWIDQELATYVEGFIADSDYAQLRKSLIEIAAAHAIWYAQRRGRRGDA